MRVKEGWQVRMAAVGLSALVLFWAWGCGRDRQSPSPAVQRATSLSDDLPVHSAELFRLPDNVSEPVYQLTVCSGGDTVAFRAGEGPKEALYFARVATGEIQKVVSGRIAEITASPVHHRFAVSFGHKEGNAWSEELLLLEDSGNLIWRVQHPTPGFYFGPRWTPDGRTLVFARERPDVTEGSADYDALGFTAIGTIDVESANLSWFPVRPPAYYFSVGPVDGYVYVSDGLNENSEKLIVTLYDLSGAIIATKRSSHGTEFSARARYYLPRLHEGGLPFEIYDSKTDRPLRKFAGLQEGFNDYENYGPWNPREDDILLLRQVAVLANGREESGGSLIYRVSTGKEVMKLPGDLCVWWPDGHSLLICRDRTFFRIPVGD
jgi:hypothetical protein